MAPDLCVAADAYRLLTEVLDDFGTEVMTSATQLARNAKRKTLHPDDLKLAGEIVLGRPWLALRSYVRVVDDGSDDEAPVVDTSRVGAAPTAAPTAVEPKSVDIE